MKTFIFIFLFINSLFAADIHMMNVQSDIEGDDVAKIGLQVSTDTTIQSILYQNYPNTPYRNFLITDLNKKSETIVKKGPVKIVELSTESITNNSINVLIHYIYEYKLTGSERRIKKIRMSYLSPLNAYVAIDTDTHKIITNAFFYVRIVNGKQVGVDRIETW